MKINSYFTTWKWFQRLIKPNNNNNNIYIYIPNLQTPILGHGAKYTNYGISLPQTCPPPSNLSATTREKTDQKFLPGKWPCTALPHIVIL